MVFIDTGVWFALLVSKDPNHQLTNHWFKTLSEPIVTSDYVTDETLTLLSMRGEGTKAIEFGNLVIVESLAILHKVTEDQFNRSWILFQQLARAGLSFTDCSSHIVSQDLGVHTIASFDHHFQISGRFQIVP